MPSQVQTVIKIDLCASKAFSALKEASNPLIRTDALKKLLDVSRQVFPDSEDRFPDGSFYKADGDAVYYLIEKPSVALRGAIEFMQSWYEQGLPAYPECRAFLDRGFVDQVPAPGKAELTGKVFENILVFEKGLQEGKIFLTEEVVDNTDHTMTKFVYHSTYSPRKGEQIRVYSVDYLDPRTVADSSLIHALFVANPKSSEARSRFYELFLIEYLLETAELSDLQTLIVWARQRNYPLPPKNELQKLLSSSDWISADTGAAPPRYRLKPEARTEIDQAKQTYLQAQKACVEEVSKSVMDTVKSSAALEGVKLDQLVEEYLCSVFSEIRMMANYFRSTYHLFESGPETFRRFEHIIKRHLGEIRRGYFEEWRDAFLLGLKVACEKDNLYIASVFHNVLATYYLNRASQASAYQVDKLKRRHIYIDTNVLYSLLVPASNYHDIAHYFVSRLQKLGVSVRVFPFTVDEYEHSLREVERNMGSGGPSQFIIEWNPWLYQEFKLNEAKYLGRMSVCRLTFSVLEDAAVTKENTDAVSERLAVHGLALESEYRLARTPEHDGELTMGPLTVLGLHLPTE
jgi:hypothetical protein